MQDLATAAMLHDIGKIFYRAGDSGNHSQSSIEFLSNEKIKIPNKNMILEVIANHHGSQLSKSDLKEDHPAYLVYEADNIAAAIDRREEEGSSFGFDKRMPLRSVFDKLTQTRDQTAYKVVGLDVKKQNLFPLEYELASQFTNPGDYNEIKNRFQKAMEGIQFEKDSMNSVLKIMEAYTSYIPSSTNKKELADISLFDHSKLTAAIACAMFQYAEESEIRDYQKYYLKDNKISRAADQFLFVSGDLSGIQKFIYTISSQGALKSLRGRSFYLEMMTETLADEVLELLNFSRANLLYSGGGHFYLLLANTKETTNHLLQAQKKINDQLLKMAGLKLYFELKGIPCSAHDLANDMNDVLKEKNLTGQLYEKVNRELAIGKLKRYEKDQLEALFDPDSLVNKELRDGRECIICKRASEDLHQWEKSDSPICGFCESMYECGDLLARLTDEEIVISLEEGIKGLIPLPSLRSKNIGMSILPLEKWLKAQAEDDYIRVYSMNQLMVGVNMATNLWVGNYTLKNPENDGLIDFKQLSDQSTGIKRLGVLRADVDNLGFTFIKGFEEPGFNTLSRFTTLSRQLSLFFKYIINNLCKKENTTIEYFTLPGKEADKKERSLVIVYSGGDDLFIVGSWDDVLEFSIDLYHAFKVFTNGSLHFSAGFSMYHPSYPISQIAKEVGELESFSKEMPEKNSIALFEEKAENRYHWETFIDEIIGEKLKAFKRWFCWEDEKD